MKNPGIGKIYATVFFVAILLTSAASTSLVGLASGQQQAPRAERNWEWINNNQFGTNYSPQSKLNKDNVRFIELKWIYPYPTDRTFAGLPTFLGSIVPPIIAEGIIYTVTHMGTVIALDGDTGKALWRTLIPALNVTEQAKIAPHVQAWAYRSHFHAVNYYADKGWVIPSTTSCNVYAFDALTGKIVMQVENLCGTEAEAKAWGNQGLYIGNSHPPQFYGNTMVVPMMGFTGRGGRSMIVGVDITDVKNPKVLWRTFLAPPAQGDPEWALRECDKGWFFSEPAYRTQGKLAIRCTEVPRENLMNDWISPQLGKLHPSNGVSTTWGHYSLDPETGIAYISSGEIGPYMNATHRPGPNLYGDSIVAIDAKTGKFVWWYATDPHDLWDFDCAWNTIFGKIGDRKVVIKACKNAFVNVLDAKTGEPIHVIDPPNLLRCGKNCMLLDPMKKEDMQRPWANYPSTGPYLQNPHVLGGIESDMAYDGRKLYFAAYNWPVMVQALPQPAIGHSVRINDFGAPKNFTVWAYDLTTGKPAWSYFVDGNGFRGGVIVTGGMVIVPAGDGNLYFIGANDGKLIHKRFFGIGLWTQVTVGQTANGDAVLLLQTGGSGTSLWQQNIPGAMMAMGIPSKLPEPQVITKEVIKEVVKEVPKEVIKEVPKEVTRTVTVETISPIAYAGIGVAVIVGVAIGIMLGRRRSA